MSRWTRDDVEKFDREMDRPHLPVFWSVVGLVAIIGLFVLSKYLEGAPTLARSTQSPRVFSDPITGCQYIVFGDRGVTPRLGTDGAPICNPPPRQDS